MACSKVLLTNFAVCSQCADLQAYYRPDQPRSRGPLLGAAQGTKRQVKVLETGGFFGEVALINHAPRAADCVAASKLKARPCPICRPSYAAIAGLDPTAAVLSMSTVQELR